MALKSPRRGVQSIRRHYSAALGSFPSRSFYVDATLGNDANSGTHPDEAWQTIGRVNGDTFLPGDRILFKRRETWRDTKLTVPSSGSAGSHIFFGAYGSGTKPIFNGSDILTTWTSYAGTTWQRTNVWSEPYQVFMDDVWLTEGADRDSLNDHEWVWAANVLYVRDDTGDPDITGVVIESGNRFWCVDQNGQSYVTISDLFLEKPNGVGLLVDGSCSNVTVRNIDARQFSTTGIHVDNSGSPGDSSRITIDNCTAYDGILRGIHLNAVGAECAVRNCTVYDVVENTYCIGIDFDGYPGVMSGQIAENNLVYNIDVGGSVGYGIQLENCDDGPIMRNNIVHNCSFSGLSIIAYDAHAAVPDMRGVIMDGRIYNNLVYECATGLSVYNTAGWDIWHNTLADCTNAEVLIWPDVGHPEYVTDISFKNNIGDTENILIAFREDYWDALDDHDYNIYFGVDKFTVDNPPADKTLAQFQTETSQEANSAYDDPDFVNAGADNYHLLAASPCVGAGVNVGITEDLDGVTRGDPPDCGAYEYVP